MSTSIKTRLDRIEATVASSSADRRCPFCGQYPTPILVVFDDDAEEVCCMQCGGPLSPDLFEPVKGYGSFILAWIRGEVEYVNARNWKRPHDGSTPVFYPRGGVGEARLV